MRLMSWLGLCCVEFLLWGIEIVLCVVIVRLV